MKTIVPILLKVPRFHIGFASAVHHIDSCLCLETLARPEIRVVDSTASAEIRLSECDILKLYEHVPLPILTKLCTQFAHQPLIVWFVSGQGDVVRRLNLLKGADVDPRVCIPGTWRRDLGEMLGFRTYLLPDATGNLTVLTYDNFVHVSSEQELKKDMDVFDRVRK